MELFDKRMTNAVVTKAAVLKLKETAKEYSEMLQNPSVFDEVELEAMEITLEIIQDLIVSYSNELCDVDLS